MQSPTETMKSHSFVFVVLFLSVLVLSGCGGGPSVTSTPVQPTPTVNVTLSPSAVLPGQSATLTWSSTNAASCTGNGSWSGTLPASGSMTVMLQGAATQTYTLQCLGGGRAVENTASLALAPTEGACAVSAAVRAHSGKRSALRRKLTGSHS